MKININQENDQVRVALQGELDTVATTQMADELNAVTDYADKQLVIDCTELDYISSSGLRFFMQLKRATEKRGGGIVIEHLNDEVADIFRMSGFNNIFEIR